MAEVILSALKESVQPQGARGLNLKRPTSGDTPLYEVPELQLNMCMLSELFVQILASGLGALALVWATVVLLGGFSASLDMADFWVITAIVFIQTARVVGINISPEAEFFNQVPQAFLEVGTENYKALGRGEPLTDQATRSKKFVYYAMLGLGRARDFIAIMAFLAVLVLAVPMIAGLGCISLSIYRLFSILSRHHDSSNVFRALILFYALVLLQGGLFIMWLFLRLYRSYLANRVSCKYGLKDKRKFIEDYMDKTLSTAIQNGVSSTINRELASFAADLIKSDHSQDHIDAVFVIHTLTSQEDHRTRTPSQEYHRTRTLSQIQSSPLCVSRLLDMVTSRSRTDQRTKLCIAEIVAHLASNLRLADISGATDSISSMIDPYFIKLSTPVNNVNIDHQRAIQITNDQQGRKPLIIHGLLILAKLAVNPDNCKQIYDSKSLFAKIISPVKNKVYEIPSYDGIPMEIAEKALEVVSMLVSGTNETNGKIRQDICSNGIAVNYIRPIFERDHMCDKLKVPATKVLTELYLDMSTRATIGLDDIAVFIEVLMNIFFDAATESGLRKTAGKALAGLAMDNANNCTTIVNFSTGTETSVQLLTAMITGADNRLYPTDIAQLLMQLCVNSNSNAERERLKSVKKNLHEVLKVICNVEQAANTNRWNSVLGPVRSHAANRNAGGDNLAAAAQLVGDRRKSLAAFLGLGLQICEKLNVSADEFDTTLARIPLSMGEFVNKLNDIIEQCKGHSLDISEGKAPSMDYLIIVKTVTKLCTWMMSNKPDCNNEFNEQHTSTKLQGALEDMRELELGMLLTGSAGDMANYETLSAIVATARQKMDANVLGRNG